MTQKFIVIKLKKIRKVCDINKKDLERLNNLQKKRKEKL